MNSKEYEKMFYAEENHWWFCGMRYRYLSKITKYLSAESPVLELGMGTGIVLSEMRKRGMNAVGADRSYEALRWASRRQGIPLIQARGEELPFRENSLKGVVCFDVLEHVQTDGGFIRSIERSMVPGAILILSVPAHPFLWSTHDEQLGHHRRYTRRRLRQLLVENRFDIISLEWLNITLFPLIALYRLCREKINRDKIAPENDLRPVPSWLNFILKIVLKAEKFWTPLVPFAPGLSLLAVAKKT